MRTRDDETESRGGFEETPEGATPDEEKDQEASSHHEKREGEWWRNEGGNGEVQ